MRLLGYPADKISILTTYNGQKHLLRDVIAARTAWNPSIGMPDKITTVDKYQGRQNDYILLSLVRETLFFFFTPLGSLLFSSCRVYTELVRPVRLMSSVRFFRLLLLSVVFCRFGREMSVISGTYVGLWWRCLALGSECTCFVVRISSRRASSLRLHSTCYSSCKCYPTIFSWDKRESTFFSLC